MVLEAVEIVPKMFDATVVEGVLTAPVPNTIEGFVEAVVVPKETDVLFVAPKPEALEPPKEKAPGFVVVSTAGPVGLGKGVGGVLPKSNLNPPILGTVVWLVTGLGAAGKLNNCDGGLENAETEEAVVI